MDIEPIMDDKKVESTLNKTFAFLKWYAARDRSGAPKAVEKKPEKAADSDTGSPDWLERWHALRDRRE